MSVTDPYPAAAKELSWLSFNARVMQEAENPKLPLIERIRFLGIYSNNLDEFFRVRVAELRRRALIHDRYYPATDNPDRQLMQLVNDQIRALALRYSEIMKALFEEQKQQGVHLVNRHFELDDAQLTWTRQYFEKKVLPHLSPVLVRDETDLGASLKDGVSYLMVDLPRTQSVHYALVEIPTDVLPRYVPMPSELGQEGARYVIPLDNIIRYGLPRLFRGILPYRDTKAYAILVNRDAEYDLTDEIDQSLLDRMSLSLRQRLTAEPVRLSYDREMPSSMLHFLQNNLGLSDYDSLFELGGYLKLADLMRFPNLIGSSAKFPSMHTLHCREFDAADTVFDAIRQQDILLYYPYHSFNYFTELVRQASFDPQVVQIKINIYRVAKDSRVLNALLDAVNNGKQVTVVVELRARFDEAANIDWARRLTQAGVHVEFGAPSLKIHSKLCLVQREEDGNIVNYAHLGTGNFHEGTAKVYTDFSLFTAHPEITREVEEVFRFIDSHYRRFDFNYLLVSPNNIREPLYALIDNEITKAANGKPAEIFIKVNNLVDVGLCEGLYLASQSGVRVRGIIRGMCSLVPGIKNVSDNIELRSIVGRFLEHPRVYVFGVGKDAKVYISSADWMRRNIDKRIEVACPILDSKLKQRLLDILELQWRDNTKSRVLDAEMSNRFVTRDKKSAELDSQLATYTYIEQMEAGESRKAALKAAEKGS